MPLLPKASVSDDPREPEASFHITIADLDISSTEAGARLVALSFLIFTSAHIVTQGSIVQATLVISWAGSACSMSAMAPKASLLWRMSSWAALLTVLSGTWTGLALGTMHQEGPNNSLQTCCIPASLGSFQGTYHCNSSVMIFQSGSAEEIAGILQEFKVVKEEGTNCSCQQWWEEQVHLGDNASVLTELNITLALHNPMPADSLSHGASINRMEAFLLGVACALAAVALLTLAATRPSMPIMVSAIIARGGALLGIAVVGVVGACAGWGTPGGLAIAASCTWFASPAVAVGLMALMLGSIKKAGIKVNKPLERAFHLLPWLVSGTLAVTLAQILKADLAKGWAAWLQALVAIGVGVGALAVTWGYMEQAQQEGSPQNPSENAEAQPVDRLCIGRHQDLPAPLAVPVARASQGSGPSFQEADKAKKHPYSYEQQLKTGDQSSEEFWELRSPHFLPSECVMERSKMGCCAADICDSIGGSSLVVMSKGNGMHYIKQAYTVDDKFPSEFVSKWWEKGFYITSVVTLPTHWAVVMSQDAGFEDQHVDVIENADPIKSTRIDSRGPSACGGDYLEDFQVTACAATKLLIATVLSKPVDKAQTSLDKSASPLPRSGTIEPGGCTVSGSCTTTQRASPENQQSSQGDMGMQGAVGVRTKQAKAVIEAEEASMPFKEGQDHYLISARWWKLWKAYSGVVEEDGRLTCPPKRETPNPGPIPNTELLEVKDDHSSLRSNVDEGPGYKILSQGSWNFLSKLYGGGPAIPRPVLPICGKLQVEVRPLTLQAFRWPNYNKAKPLKISRRATAAELKTAACTLFKLEEKDVEVCDYYTCGIYASLEGSWKAAKKLEDVQINGPQHILVGEKSAEGIWPSEEKGKYRRRETQRLGALSA